MKTKPTSLYCEVVNDATMPRPVHEVFKDTYIHTRVTEVAVIHTCKFCGERWYTEVKI